MTTDEKPAPMSETSAWFFSTMAVVFMLGIVLGFAGGYVAGKSVTEAPSPRQTETKVFWLENEVGSIRIRIEPREDRKTASLLMEYLNRFPGATVQGLGLPENE